MIATVSRLVELILDSQVLNAAQCDKLRDNLQDRCKEPYQLAKDLLRRGWLTDYQLELIIKGDGQDLLLGPFIVLEPLGEGCMGQVFKARRRENGQLVALKMVHRDRRGDLRALHRFRREVEALAQLSHPNIITACDVSEIGIAHYYAMEYVEGINLERVIAANGPLPLGAACDYVRQAALGLQHAHERGLIHRDIKPGNLLVARPESDLKKTLGPGMSPEARARFNRWGIVKILDLGLVRLENQDSFEGNGQMKLTQEGFSLGTVDYMAPEQIHDPHKVDIRADLYSLGCTFYEALVGQPPFPEGSLLEKLQGHKSRTPPPVNQLRPDVPEAAAEVVARLLAKQPEDRYQEPGQVAGALAGVLVRMDRPLLGWDWRPQEQSVKVRRAAETREQVIHPPPSESDRLHWLLLAGILALLFSFLVALLAR
ncbi:MAG: serine/threonine protein kinase [Planctomycetia bacterium]|nr:serine/threonine protein kinase [Planctomycetia bacterium]